MWFFNKKTTIAASGILVGATDHHSHILPGVDDGVDTMDEALRILATYETLGIKELWLTPHIMEDIPNTPEKLKARFAELKEAYNGGIELHLAAEYMIDNNLHKLLQDYHFEPKGEISPTKNCPSCVRGTSEAEGDDNTQNSPSLQRGAVQSKPFQETPPLFRGEVVEDRRGEKKTTEYLMRHELSEVTEGNQTNNCPSYVRGASDAVAEGVDITNTQRINSPSLIKREYPKGEGVETNNLLYSSEGAVRNNSTACDDGCFSIPKESPLGLTQGEGVIFLPIGKKHDHLLVETSYFTPPMRLHETLQKIKSSGYHPLLAHPERYMYMEKSDYIELNKKGVKFQLNIISLAGGYGNTVKKKAEWLLSNGLYSVAGSDLHCEDAIGYITLCKLGKNNIRIIKRLLKNNI